MKSLFTLILLLITTIVFAQSDTIYFDKDWKKCEANQAKYYRFIFPDGKKFIAKDYYLITIRK